MKTRKPAIVVLAAALFFAGTAFSANSNASGRHPWIGVLLDTRPLPGLLVKHLRLAPGQGFRIANVHRGSPADKAGLERDDIIIGFQGKNVTNYDTFVNQVHKAGVGTEVSLTIIHLGKRKTIKLKLEPFKEGLKLKYPPEPQTMETWRPSRIFRLRPSDKQWIEMMRNNLNRLEGNLPPVFNELYIVQHSGTENYTIKIEGNPNSDQAAVSVHVGDTTHRTIAKYIDKLPEKYREPAKQALKGAKEAAAKAESQRRSSWRMPSDWKPFLDRPWQGENSPAVRSGPSSQMLERMQKQIHELQERLDKLQKHQSPTPEPGTSGGRT